VMVSAHVVNNAQVSLDLTCSLPISTKLVDAQQRNFDAIDYLYKVKGNPECNDQLQPGFESDMTWVYLVPKTASVIGWALRTTPTSVTTRPCASTPERRPGRSALSSASWLLHGPCRAGQLWNTSTPAPARLDLVATSAAEVGPGPGSRRAAGLMRSVRSMTLVEDEEAPAAAGLRRADAGAKWTTPGSCSPRDRAVRCRPTRWSSTGTTSARPPGSERSGSTTSKDWET
jgi:hypothetical protein